MSAEQDLYEKQSRDDIIAMVIEISRIAAQIEAAAKAARPVPISTKEYLKKISTAMAACQSVLDEHMQGDKFSDATIRTVAKALENIHHSIDSLVLFAAMDDIRRQG